MLGLNPAQCRRLGVAVLFVLSMPSFLELVVRCQDAKLPRRRTRRWVRVRVRMLMRRLRSEAQRIGGRVARWRYAQLQLLPMRLRVVERWAEGVGVKAVSCIESLQAGVQVVVVRIGPVRGRGRRVLRVWREVLRLDVAWSG